LKSYSFRNEIKNLVVLFKKNIMTKKDFIFLSGLFFSILVSLNCNKKYNNSTCLSYRAGTVTKVDGPNTGSINQEIFLLVSFSCTSDCGDFGYFEQSANGNTTTINVIAKYEGCLCTQNIPTRQTTYKFNATQTGTYYLKFFKTTGNYLIDTITIR